MNVYWTLLILLLCTSCEPTTHKEQRTEKRIVEEYVEDTVAAKEQALDDCKHGKPKVYIVGMTDDFDSYFGQYLKTEKGITPIFSGCVVTGEIETYNRTIEECLELKYGRGFLRKWQKEAYDRYKNRQR